jgi:hypothetical protein
MPSAAESTLKQRRRILVIIHHKNAEGLQGGILIFNPPLSNQASWNLQPIFPCPFGC